MSNIKQTYYNIDKIKSIGANYNIIYGERSNGKSYQVKHKMGIEHYIKTGKRFILMRRWREEITTEKIESYFKDVDVYSLTNGNYNCIVMYRKKLYFANFDDETFKTKRGEHIGYVVALSTEQNYAGGSYLDVDNIIFEEFMSRSMYLANEPSKLMNFYSTVDRKRSIVKIWMVGNSISRVCPYINEWGLTKIMRRQKQGDITVKEIKDSDDFIIKIAVEYCKTLGKSGHTLGNNKAMIDTGSWQTSPQPMLPKSKNSYKVIFRLGFEYQDFRFIGELLKDKTDTKNICWFIYPHEDEFKDDMIIISDKVKIQRNWNRDIYHLNVSNPRLQKICDTFIEDQIFYSTDLCGTDFKQVIDFSIRKGIR